MSWKDFCHKNHNFSVESKRNH